LRGARLAVGDDLTYLGQHLPVISNFPETQKLIQVHQDLVHIDDLKRKETRGDVPRLLDNQQSTIEAAMRLLDDLSKLSDLRVKLSAVSEPWVEKLTSYLRKNNSSDVMAYLVPLIVDIEAVLSARKTFLARPISIPRDLDRDDVLMKAITNLSEGKSAFGLTGVFGKNEQKRTLSEITVTGDLPKSTDDWKHVLDYLSLHKQARSLLSRWNALADEIPLPSFETTPDQLSKAGQVIETRDTIRRLLNKESVVIAGLKSIIPSWFACSRIPVEPGLLDEAKSILNHHLMQYRLAETWVTKESFLRALSGCDGEITHQIRKFMDGSLGKHGVEVSDIQSEWSSLMERLRKLHEHSADLKTIERATSLIQTSGAPLWAQQLRSQVRGETNDPLLPDQWAEGWRLKRLSTHLDAIDGRQELRRLFDLRVTSERNLAKAYKQAVVKRTWLKISENATHSVKAALEAFRTAIQKIGKGTGIRAARYRQDARVASDQANIAIPCWIMPHYRVSESLPSNFGAFDLVIIDEASQSDLTALPAILRAKKVLIVGDDKQVSPEGVGLDVVRIQGLMARFLSNQVDLYRSLMAPDRSVYDLFKVVFAKSAVMLREHFRCVAPIIEYSKREFYNHELKPLRLPKASERLDPPLVDVYVKDGYRKDKINPAEARYIIDEIHRIVGDPAFSNRSIGVVSLLGAEQALRIMEQLNDELGEDVVTRHEIACGDARTFQGKERDIMFLSMVVVPGHAHAQSKDSTAQRFNVAASRARDRMYLVRSIEPDELSSADKLREGLIQHFQVPFAQNPREVKDLRELCESPFECEVFDLLTERGYRVIPQVPVGAYRIDLVVEGDNDQRLAIECDGDRYHGPDQWDADMRRQRILERAGWRFWRSFASTFVMRRVEVVQDLIDTLTHHGIHPATGCKAYTSIHVELRRVSAYEHESERQDQVPEDVHEVENAQNVFELTPLSLAPLPTQVDIQFNKQPPQENRQDEALVVELDDLVKFEHSAKPGVYITAQITSSRNDLENGYISIQSPLAQTLLGLEEGEEGEMHLQGMSPKRIRVVEIVRQK
jgi:very-short-patch-repair endonuclease